MLESSSATKRHTHEYDATVDINTNTKPKKTESLNTSTTGSTTHQKTSSGEQRKEMGYTALIGFRSTFQVTTTSVDSIAVGMILCTVPELGI